MRPCFLVVDREYPGTLSTRKLVIESAKFNVLTAYSADEATEILSRFPQVDGVVLDSELKGKISCTELIEQLRAIRNDVPLIVVSPSGMETCDHEHHLVCSLDPQQLLEQVRQIAPWEPEQRKQDNE